MKAVNLIRCGEMYKVLDEKHYDLIESILFSHQDNAALICDYLNAISWYRRNIANEEFFEYLTRLLVSYGKYVSERYIDALFYRAILDRELDEVVEAFDRGANAYAWANDVDTILRECNLREIKSVIDDLRNHSKRLT